MKYEALIVYEQPGEATLQEIESLSDAVELGFHNKEALLFAIHYLLDNFPVKLKLLSCPDLKAFNYKESEDFKRLVTADPSLPVYVVGETTKGVAGSLIKYFDELSKNNVLHLEFTLIEGILPQPVPLDLNYVAELKLDSLTNLK
jgi:hypothetical protein